ncbi:MAG: hypothetical protein NTX97_13535 [Bacteroidetes bacterium]|nr:hypothetical protein [Bacteroidota bacterium]
MRFRYFTFLFFITVYSNAQIAGYMGKRFSIGYSNYFMVSAIGPTANAISPSGNRGVNTTHCLNLEYTIKNRTNFCLSLQNSNTGVDPGDLGVQKINSFDNSYAYYDYRYAPKPYKPMNVNSYNVGLGFKFFQSGSLAPIGKYKKLELLLMFNHFTYQNTAFTYYDFNSSTNASGVIGTGDYHFKTFALTYTIGRSRVLFDRIVIDYGFRFGFVPAGVWAVLTADGATLIETPNSTVTEQRFKYDVNTRLFKYQLVNFHIGLSFLAF